jgi:hypothetical protein
MTGCHPPCVVIDPMSGRHTYENNLPVICEFIADNLIPAD